MTDWVDPRSNPQPAYCGVPPACAQSEEQLADLLLAFKAGRFYDAERWFSLNGSGGSGAYCVIGESGARLLG